MGFNLRFAAFLCLFLFLGLSVIPGCSSPVEEVAVPVEEASSDETADEFSVVGLGLKEIPVPKPTGSRTHFITFADLELPMKEDSKFRPEMLTQRVVDLQNQRVKLRGFIFPMFGSKISKFPLLKNTDCPFGEGGIAHHVVFVRMAEGKTVLYKEKMFTVEGVLTIDLFHGDNGDTWSVYTLQCDRAY
jgi:hypothetical protein